MRNQAHLAAGLGHFLETFGGVAGTVHVVRGDDLVMVADVNIPDAVRSVTAIIPRGKGMAGISWERDEPVQTCNLKDDASGDVRPGARAVDAQAAVAFPVHDGQGEVVAIVGIAFRDERELSDSEIGEFMVHADAIIRESDG